MKKATITAAVLFLVMLACVPAHAQNKTGFVGWGLRGGFNISNYVGSDATFPGDLPYKTKAGFAGGVWAVWGISERFAIQPEVIFSQKGSRVVSGDSRVEFNASYIEFPLLLKVRAIDDMPVKPSLYFGPTVSMVVDDKGSRVYKGPAIPLTLEDQAIQAYPAEFEMDTRSVDYGFVAGIDFHAVEDKAVVDIRYTHGMKTVDKSGDTDLRNSNISVSIGYAFF